MTRPRLILAAVLAAVCVGAVAVAATGSADASAKGRAAQLRAVAPSGDGFRYVALGDSYTSAPGVPPIAGDAPPICGRSAANYPHLVAARLGARLVDVSCGGARTHDLAQSQRSSIAPQFDALTPDTRLVTVGIGGNDNNLFATAIAGCTATVFDVLTGSLAPCRDRYGDRFEKDIAGTGASVRKALKQIRAAAPDAQIVVVGYPALLPATAAGQLACVAAGVPFTPGDIEYLGGIERSLNAALERAASGLTSTTFLDTYAPSVGHDMCQLPGVRWIEPLIPISPAAPVHPNAAGQAAVAANLAAAVRPGA